MVQNSDKTKISPTWIAGGLAIAGIAVILGSMFSPANAQPPAGAFPGGPAGASGGGRGGGGFGGGRGALQFADWATFGHDPQRTGFAFEETRISPESISQMKLVWKTKIDSEAYQVYNLTPPIVVGAVPTAKGIRPVVYTQSSLTGTVYAIDAQTGEQLWDHKFQAGMTAVAQRDGGFQYQGGMLCPPAPAGSMVADKASDILYAISPFGKIYGLDLGSGEIRYPGTQFVVPFAKVTNLMFVNGVVYTTLAQGCGDARSGFYAIDVRDKENPRVYQGLTSVGGSAGPWGHGAAFGTNGRIFGGTADGDFDPQNGTYSNALMAMSTDNLKLVDYYLPVNWRILRQRDFDMGAAAPVFFGWKNRNIVAHGAKESVITLSDADNLGGADHQTPLFVGPRLGNDGQSGLTGHGIWGGMSISRDLEGNTWVLAPVGGPPAKEGPKFPLSNGPVTHGSLMAFRVLPDSKTGNPFLQPEWISSDLDMPDGIVSANGVVFALSTGADESQRDQTAGRITNGKPAVLKAFDLKTGKDLWNSGTAFESWMHFSGLAISGGSVFAVDHAGNVYNFGGLPAPAGRGGGGGGRGASGGFGGRGASGGRGQ